jgi:hypothetical protein
MATYVNPNQRELQERILFLQLTVAALQAQLDCEEVKAAELALEASRTGPTTSLETPLAIAAG